MTGTPPPIGRAVVDQDTRYNLHLHFAIQLPKGKLMGDETLRLVNFSGHDGISDHFEYQLELHGDTDPAKQVSPNLAFRFDELIGRPVTVGIDQPTARGARGLPPSSNPYTKEESCALFLDAVTGNWPADAKESADDQFSFFNGIVASFAMTEPGVYQLTMRPAAWKATLTNRYRIHTQCSIRDAITRVLDEHDVAYTADAVSGGDNPAVYRIQDWLQAGESDYDFIHRLMNKAFIYYYYLHGPEGHTLVLANRPEYGPVYASGRKLRYAFTSEDPLGQEQEDLITQYRYEKTLTSSGVDDILSRQEAAWEECSVAGTSSYGDATNEAGDSNTPGDLPFRRFRIYQYGGSGDEVSWDAKQVADTINTSSTSLSGAGHCARFRAGLQFQLEDASATGVSPSMIRPTLPEQPFVLTRVQHTASLDGTYSNQFQATEADGLVAPYSIQDTQQGSVMAHVVHVDNGTPPKDWKYYYKDNFDPEQHRWKDPHCPDPEGARQFRPEGVYVKFLTDGDNDPPRWVKLAAHMQTAPEIGVTVMVARSYYADELPEIQSIVQNNGNKTVTPCGWTASTSVGSNYGTSYGDSKSVRFGLKSNADLDNAKGIVEGEYASGQFRDSSYSQGASYSYSTSENGRSGILSKSDTFGKTYSTFESDETKSWSDITYSYSKSTIGTTDSVSDIGTSNSTSTVGTSNSTSDVGLSNSTSTVGTSNSTSTVGLSNSTSTVGTSNSNSTVGTTNSTSLVGMSNSASAVGMSNSANAVGMSNSASTVGMSNSLNLVGMNNSIGITGVSVGVGVTGVSVGASVTGLSTSTSTVGLSNNTSAVGLSNSTSAVGLSNSTNMVGLTNSTNMTGLSNSTSMTGLANSTGLTGLVSSTDLTGARTSTSLVGSSTNTSITGAVTETSITGSVTSISVKGSTTAVDVQGSSVKVSVDSGGVAINLQGTNLNMISTIEIVL